MSTKLTKEDALVLIMREWRAREPVDRQTEEQATRFAADAVERHRFVSRRDRVELVMSFLRRELIAPPLNEATAET